MKKSLTVIFIVLISSFVSILPAQEAGYTNFIGMKFKNILSGCFYMGSCREAKYLEAENRVSEKVENYLVTGEMRCPSGCSADVDALFKEVPQHGVCITNQKTPQFVLI